MRFVNRQTSSALQTVSRPDPRKRLLQSMLDTVALRGYDCTTVSRVLASADVQEAVFTEHFHDKRDCLMQAIEEALSHVERTGVELFELDCPWAERVRLALGALLSAIVEHRSAARVVLVDMLGIGEDASERYRRSLELFTALIEQGRPDSGGAEHLPPQTSEAIVGGIVSILHRRVLQDEVDELELLHADLTYFALLPYLDHEQAQAVAGLA